MAAESLILSVQVYAIWTPAASRDRPCKCVGRTSKGWLVGFNWEDGGHPCRSGLSKTSFNFMAAVTICSDFGKYLYNVVRGKGESRGRWQERGGTDTAG